MKHARYLVMLIVLPVSAQEPRLGKIAVYGNTRTRSSVIVREFNLKPEERLTEPVLKRERQWLLRLDNWKKVEFQLKPSADAGKDLVVVVEERGNWGIYPLLSNDYRFGWRGGFRLRRRNLWGLRHEAEITAELGGIDKLLLDYRIPWWAKRWRLFTGLSFRRTSFLYQYPDVEEPFPFRETVLLAVTGKQFGRSLRIGAAAGVTETEPSPESSRPAGPERFIRWEGFLELDTRDWPRYPRSGVYSRFWHLQMESESNFFRKTGMEARLYTPLFYRNCLAVHAWAEWAHQPLPLTHRLRLGGGNSIRGYHLGDLSGDSGSFISTEYRIPVAFEGNPLAGIHAGYSVVLFMDTGSAWPANQALSKTRWVRASGAGLHFLWDKWLLRLEYGRRHHGGFINVATGVKF